MNGLFESVGTILFSVATVVALIIACAKWLSEIIAKRLEQSYQLSLDKIKENEIDLLLRRREVYTKLIKSMRVFITSDNANTVEEKKDFLSAYDECCLWAPDNVLNAIGTFLDISNQYSSNPKSIDQKTYQASFKKCIEEIRMDCGFEKTKLEYRFVIFEN